ncbi:MAG TPA: hypothetical protein VFO67_21120 [Gemmatimonadales bacterium]|nr:hypothetical protein [Gemmatimonadales bacterium]
MTGRWRVAAILAAAVGGGAACADDPTSPDPLDAAQAARVAPRLAVMTYLVATASWGRSFFDNFLPCLERGALSYVDSDRGRRVWFRGCDLGTGLVIEGSGEIEWAAAAPGPDREPFCTFGPSATCATGFRWNGTLAITIDDSVTVVLADYEVTDVSVTVGVDTIQLQSLNVLIAGSNVPMDDPALAAELFDATGRTLDHIPNPSQSVSALSQADLHRLAYDGISVLASFLLDETQEAGRGDHVHTLSCGTSSVTYDAQQLPTITSTWNGCLINGLIYDGSFTMKWGRWDISQNSFDAIRLDVSGTLTVGGAVPRVGVTSLQVLMSNADGGGIEGTLGVRLTLTGTGGSRSLAVNVPVDD